MDVDMDLGLALDRSALLARRNAVPAHEPQVIGVSVRNPL